MSIWTQFWNHPDRLVHKYSHYLPIYQRHFEDWVDRPVTFLEIGCGHGGSMQMWKGFFGPQAQIIGLDVREECKRYEEPQVHIRIGSQQDENFLAAIVQEFGPPDIVVDDGSHVMRHIQKSFSFLYSKMPKTGVYLVEDLHFAYNEKFGGGFRRPDSFIEIAKGLIDQLHARDTNGALAPDQFTRDTVGIHFYDSVIVFERGRHGSRIDYHRGRRPVVSTET